MTLILLWDMSLAHDVFTMCCMLISEFMTIWNVVDVWRINWLWSTEGSKSKHSFLRKILDLGWAWAWEATSDDPLEGFVLYFYSIVFKGIWLVFSWQKLQSLYFLFLKESWIWSWKNGLTGWAYFITNSKEHNIKLGLDSTC